MPLIFSFFFYFGKQNASVSVSTLGIFFRYFLFFVLFIYLWICNRACIHSSKKVPALDANLKIVLLGGLSVHLNCKIISQQVSTAHLRDGRVENLVINPIRVISVNQDVRASGLLVCICRMGDVIKSVKPSHNVSLLRTSDAVTVGRATASVCLILSLVWGVISNGIQSSCLLQRLWRNESWHYFSDPNNAYQSHW